MFHSFENVVPRRSWPRQHLRSAQLQSEEETTQSSEELLHDSQVPNLALTVLLVPYSLDSGKEKEGDEEEEEEGADLFVASRPRYSSDVVHR